MKTTPCRASLVVIIASVAGAAGALVYSAENEAAVLVVGLPSPAPGIRLAHATRLAPVHTRLRIRPAEPPRLVRADGEVSLPLLSLVF